MAVLSQNCDIDKRSKKLDSPRLCMGGQEFSYVPKIMNGGLAGIVGVTCVFPIDLVKTRLQNQPILANGEVQYKGMCQCPSMIINWACKEMALLLESVVSVKAREQMIVPGSATVSHQMLAKNR
ncbi:hypothetical protein ANCCAN_17545 [Ancylostoma caninum]|uniref:Uncharacterized protein n=1 Tax=Ancylostoma caninum TaxID=29170 RepID=A0A368G0M0_ANCCA|nr:hypothetical protein ANCCAN_17545 [Ancylostoma caninum]